MTESDVLFLHSFGLDGRAATWLPVANLLAPTLPNHGAGSRLSELTIAGMVDEIAGTLSGPVDVIGCSVGGMLALHFALEHPHLVRSLALVCTAAWVPRQIILDRADETVSVSREEFVMSTLDRWFTPTALATPTAPVTYAIECLQTADRAGLAEVWRAVAEHDVRERLGEIAVPTTCIAAMADVSAPPVRSEELRNGIPSARLVLMESAHMAYLEQPDRFAEIITTHLKEVSR